MLKLSEIITQQPKTLEIPNIADIKSVFIEHPKPENVENVSLESGAGKNSESTLYSETKKGNIIWMKKKKKCNNNEMISCLQVLIIFNSFTTT